MADRYSYVPSIGILLVLVWGAQELTRGWRYQGAAATALAAAAALACAGLTWRQLGYWKDTESLFRHALLVTKDNYGAHHGLGMALDRQERLDEAISEYRQLSERTATTSWLTTTWGLIWRPRASRGGHEPVPDRPEDSARICRPA